MTVTTSDSGGNTTKDYDRDKLLEDLPHHVEIFDYLSSRAFTPHARGISSHSSLIHSTSDNWGFGNALDMLKRHTTDDRIPNQETIQEVVNTIMKPLGNDKHSASSFHESVQAYSILDRVRIIHQGYLGEPGKLDDVWTPFWVDKTIPPNESTISKLKKLLKDPKNVESKEVFSRAFLLFKYITAILLDNMVANRGDPQKSWLFEQLHSENFNHAIEKDLLDIIFIFFRRGENSPEVIQVAHTLLTQILIVNRCGPLKDLANALFSEVKQLSLEQQMSFFQNMELHTEKLTLLHRRLTGDTESKLKTSQQGILEEYFQLAPKFTEGVVTTSTVNFQAFLLSQVHLSFVTFFPGKAAIAPNVAQECRTKWKEVMKKLKKGDEVNSPIPDSDIFMELILSSL